jgi:hypothetical protein
MIERFLGAIGCSVNEEGYKGGTPYVLRFLKLKGSFRF